MLSKFSRFIYGARNQGYRNLTNNANNNIKKGQEQLSNKQNNDGTEVLVILTICIMSFANIFISSGSSYSPKKNEYITADGLVIKSDTDLATKEDINSLISDIDNIRNKYVCVNGEIYYDIHGLNNVDKSKNNKEYTYY